MAGGDGLNTDLTADGCLGINDPDQTANGDRAPDSAAAWGTAQTPRMRGIMDKISDWGGSVHV